MSKETERTFIPETGGVKSFEEIEFDKKIAKVNKENNQEIKADLLNENVLVAEKFETETDMVRSEKDVSYEPKKGFTAEKELSRQNAGEILEEKNNGGRKTEIARAARPAGLKVAAKSLFTELQTEQKIAENAAAAEAADIEGE